MEEVIMDNELFELCKEVYEKTQWGRMDNNSPTDEYFAANPISMRLNEPDVIEGWQIWRWEDYGESGRLHYRLGKGQSVPLYTSDYLLEKLPEHIKENRFELYVGQYTSTWYCGYKGTAHAESTSPLKALLKLTLTLKKAGEL